MVKNPLCNAGDPGPVPGLGRSPGEENGNPLQCSCKENPMDRGAWRAVVRRVVESQTRLHDHVHTHKKKHKHYGKHFIVPPKSHTSVSNRNNGCVCVTVQSAKHFPARARIQRMAATPDSAPVGLWWPWLAPCLWSRDQGLH